MSRIDIRTIRRRQIIEAAEELAAQKGWAETTIADICKQADISVGGLTHHFKEKDEIMFAVLEDVMEQLGTRFRETAQANAQGHGCGISSCQEGIASFLRMLSQGDETDQKLYQLFLHFIASSLHRPDVAARLHTIFSLFRQQSVLMLQEGLKKIEKSPHNPNTMIDMLYCFSLGLALGRVIFGDDFPTSDLPQEVAAMFDLYVERQQPLNKE